MHISRTILYSIQVQGLEPIDSKSSFLLECRWLPIPTGHTNHHTFIIFPLLLSSQFVNKALSGSRRTRQHISILTATDCCNEESQKHWFDHRCEWQSRSDWPLSVRLWESAESGELRESRRPETLHHTDDAGDRWWPLTLLLATCCTHRTFLDSALLHSYATCYFKSLSVKRNQRVCC